MATTDSTQLFNDRLMNVMGMLDDILGKYNIGDGDYLAMANELLVLNRLVGNLKETTKYVYIEREVRRRAAGRETKKKPSLAEKMNNPEYTWCNSCNSPIKKSFMSEHRQTAKCSTINQIKRTTLGIKTMGNPEFHAHTLFLNRFFDANRILPNTVITERWEGQDKIQTKFILKLRRYYNGSCGVETDPTFDELIEWL